MERYARGDSTAYPDVYEALAPQLLGYLVSRTRETARAEDVLQQTLLQIHRARGRFTPGSEVLPWAFRIAQRVLVDNARRGRRELLSSDGEPYPGASNEPDADALLQARQLARRLEAELRKLPLARRIAFELVRVDGLTQAEAAQVMGTTVTSVKLRVHRASEALRRTLYPTAAALQTAESARSGMALAHTRVGGSPMKKSRKAAAGTIEGEGSYTASRAYDAAATKDANAGHSTDAGKRASKALDGPEGPSLRAADRAGKEGRVRRSSKP